MLWIRERGNGWKIFVVVTRTSSTMVNESMCIGFKDTISVGTDTTVGFYIKVTGEIFLVDV